MSTTLKIRVSVPSAPPLSVTEVDTSTSLVISFEEISLYVDPPSVESSRVSPDARAAERVAVRAAPSVSLVMKSVPELPVSSAYDPMDTVTVGATVSCKALTDAWVASFPAASATSAVTATRPSDTPVGLVIVTDHVSLLTVPVSEFPLPP